MLMTPCSSIESSQSCFLSDSTTKAVAIISFDYRVCSTVFLDLERSRV